MTTTRTDPQRGTDPAASTVRTPVTVPWRLSARTRAWLTDRPQTRRLVHAILDELAELERAGHPPDILTTVGYLLYEGIVNLGGGLVPGMIGGSSAWSVEGAGMVGTGAPSYESPTSLAGGPFRAENGLGCPLTSLLLDPV